LIPNENPICRQARIILHELDPRKTGAFVAVRWRPNDAASRSGGETRFGAL
jgi:hypothetical protein